MMADTSVPILDYDVMLKIHVTSGDRTERGQVLSP
jgi:hypothetical protein